MSRPRWLDCLSRSTFTGYGGDVDDAEEVEEGLGGCARVDGNRGNGDQHQAGYGWGGEAARRDGHICAPPRTIRR